MGQADRVLQPQARRFRTTNAFEKDRISGLTQFGQTLYKLNIDVICANTPQAKAVRSAPT
jgi:hypothetical protein